MSPILLSLLVACGGAEKAPEPVKSPPPEPKVVAPAPPPPVVAPPPAPPVTGPYTPDDLAKAAYEKAKAAGSEKVAANPKKGDATAIAAGKVTFDQKCVTCHGATGHGDGIAGTALPQKPANFHHKERWDATPAGTKLWILQNGVQGSAMAPLGLTMDQSWEVLAYIEAEFVGK